jgi:hypothetical protein
VERDLDLEGAVVWSSADPDPLTSSPSSKPSKVKNTMVWLYSRSREALTTPKASSPRPARSMLMKAGSTRSR